MADPTPPKAAPTPSSTDSDPPAATLSPAAERVPLPPGGLSPAATEGRRVPWEKVQVTLTRTSDGSKRVTNGQAAVEKYLPAGGWAPATPDDYATLVALEEANQGNPEPLRALAEKAGI
jgi:hypothetical protein